jgi:hypothetical protein
MLSEKEINLVLGKDLIETKKKEELSFRDWLTVKGIAPLTVKHTISFESFLCHDDNKQQVCHLSNILCHSYLIRTIHLYVINDAKREVVGGGVSKF